MIDISLETVTQRETLALSGLVKGLFTGVPGLNGALQAALADSLTASVAYFIARFIA